MKLNDFFGTGLFRTLVFVIGLTLVMIPIIHALKITGRDYWCMIAGIVILANAIISRTTVAWKR